MSPQPIKAKPEYVNRNKHMSISADTKIFPRHNPLKDVINRNLVDEVNIHWITIYLMQG